MIALASCLRAAATVLLCGGIVIAAHSLRANELASPSDGALACVTVDAAALEGAAAPADCADKVYYARQLRTDDAVPVAIVISEPGTWILLGLGVLGLIYIYIT